MEQWATRAHVYVSSYTAPKNWTEVWSREVPASMALKNKQSHIRTERVFTLTETKFH